MKTLTISILAWLAIAAACSAQISDPGWYNGPQRDTNSLSLPNGGSDPSTASLTAGITYALDDLVPNMAEAITPLIQDVGGGLNDPVAIYNYVHDNIQYVPYFGSKKGAQLTL